MAVSDAQTTTIVTGERQMASCRAGLPALYNDNPHVRRLEGRRGIEIKAHEPFHILRY